MELIGLIYLEPLLQAARDHTTFQDRAILTTLNHTVNELNTLILQRFLGALRTYWSIDSTDIAKSKT
jgi:hypothetical protein